MPLNQETHHIESNLLIEINPEGFCVKTNPALPEITGYLSQELMGKKFKDFLDIEPSKLHAVETRIATDEDAVVNFEAGFRHKTGKYIYLLWTMYWSKLQNSVICIGKPLYGNEQKFLKENKELQLLNAINECIQHNHEPAELFDGLCKIMVKTGKYQLAWVGKYNPSYLEIWFKESEEYISDEQFNQSKFIQKMYDEWKNKENETSGVAVHLSNDECNALLPSINTNLRSLFLLPIDLGEEKKWVFSVASADENAFDIHEKLVMERIAANLTYALKSVQIEKNNQSNESSLKKYIHELTLLNEINNLILINKEENSLIKEFLNILVKRGNYKLAWLAYFEKNKEKATPIVPNYFAGETAYATKLNYDLNKPEILKGPVATNILTQKTCIVNSLQEDQTYAQWRDLAHQHGVKSTISLYLDIEGKQKATLSIYSGNKNAFDNREAIVLERCAHNLTYAISAIRKNTQSIQFGQELDLSKKILTDYQMALDTIAIISLTDKDGLITKVNENFEKTFGFSSYEVIGTNHKFINSGFHPKSFWKELWETITIGKIWTGEIKNIDKIGEEKWYDTTIYPFLDASGKPYQYLAIRWDMTDKKVIEEKAELVNRLVSSSEEAIYSINLEGQITSWNDAAKRIFGYSAEEVIGKDKFGLIGKNKVDEENEIIKKISKGESVVNLETVRINKQGKTIHVNLSVSPLRDQQNKIIGYSKIAKDITRTRLAEIDAQQAHNDSHLREREMWLLGRLSKLMQNEAIGIDDLISKFIKMIPLGWKHSDNLSLKISIAGKEFKSKLYIETKNTLFSECIINQHEKFSIQLFYPLNLRFLEDEKNLLELICGWLGAIINNKENNALLNEKIKELETIRMVQELLNNKDLRIQDILTEIVKLLNNSEANSNKSTYQICYDNLEYGNKGASSAIQTYIENFETIDNKLGEIIHYQTAESSNLENEGFKQQKNIFINLLAEKISDSINTRILQTRNQYTENRLKTIVNLTKTIFMLLDENQNILYSSNFAIEEGEKKFGVNLKPGNNIFDNQIAETKEYFSKILDPTSNTNEISFTLERSTLHGHLHCFEISLIKTTNEESGKFEILFIAQDVSHLKQREKDVNNLVNLLKDLNFISSFELSHEFYKLQSIAELAQDLEFEDNDLKTIFSHSKSTFQKADAAIKKLVERINIPLQEELIIADSLRRIDKIILIDEDDISSKISTLILAKYFDPIQIICFNGVDETFAYFKSKGDNGNDIILLELNLVNKSGWEFLAQYDAQQLRSPVIIFGSNPDPVIKQKLLNFPCVKNYINKPINKESAQALVSKEALSWNAPKKTK